jgi:hypothetical protein
MVFSFFFLSGQLGSLQTFLFLHRWARGTNLGVSEAEAEETSQSSTIEQVSGAGVHSFVSSGLSFSFEGSCGMSGSRVGLSDGGRAGVCASINELEYNLHDWQDHLDLYATD